MLTACDGKTNKSISPIVLDTQEEASSEYDIIPAAERLALYYPKLVDKKVGLVVNQTSRVGESHIVDTLMEMGINVTQIFSPEHGFSGAADAGEQVTDGQYRGAKITSLYGKKKKPSSTDLSEVDILVFDIQDVGIRFYTYISTLHYIMKVANEENIPLMVLDRPNPNGFYIDGPVLEPRFSSFVGMHPVPVVYGMTIGEYALMIKGEKWIDNADKLQLEIVECKNYTHDRLYNLPVKPSPNLPNLRSILLYPSLCFFEGTTVSIGRGTHDQFQVIGHPALHDEEYNFIPDSMPGAKHPKHKNLTCYGENLQNISPDRLHNDAVLNLDYLIDYYKKLTEAGEEFFLDNDFFNKLAGTDKLKIAIEKGQSANDIRQGWQEDLENFKKIRSKYLLYD